MDTVGEGGAPLPPPPPSPSPSPLPPAHLPINNINFVLIAASVATLEDKTRDVDVVLPKSRM